MVTENKFEKEVLRIHYSAIKRFYPKMGSLLHSKMTNYVAMAYLGPCETSIMKYFAKICENSSQPAISCSKLTKETLEQEVKYAQS